MMALLGAKDAVRLNLEHLSFADAAGIEMLREVRSDGVQLIGASPLIEGLLATPCATDGNGRCRGRTRMISDRDPGRKVTLSRSGGIIF